MLTHLKVKNFAIVAAAEIAFGSGLNIITGETGAGKSILMGALQLVLGGRADRSAIRDGAADAWVEATFSLSNTTAIDALLSKLHIPRCDEGALLIRRSVAATGAGRCLVNDTPTTVQTLRRLGALLVDIHGPYDHQSLLHPDFQRDVLDAYGNCANQRASCLKHWQELRDLEQQVKKLDSSAENVITEIDHLEYMIDEISSAALSEADEGELIATHAQAANAEQILHLGTLISDALTEGQQSAFDLLSDVQTNLGELARIMPEAAAWRSEAQSIAMQLQELGRAVVDRITQVEASPDELAQLEARMALVQRLKRKYGRSIADILATLAQHKARLQNLLGRSEQIVELETKIVAARAAHLTDCAELRKIRALEALRLARAITNELRDLGFLRAGFSVEISATTPGPHGSDNIVFGFAPNPGESTRPLKSIASSGEIARVMLAVKAVLSTHDNIPILVFDEIDANIGGEVGKVVGQKMRYVARNHQVISITHLPQSAVYGSHHFVVSKEVVKGRTHMRVALLNATERTDEIARMLGGKSSSGIVERHANELIAAAQRESE